MGTCMLCGSDNHRTVITKLIDYEYWINFDSDLEMCNNCGLMYQNPIPSADILPSYYPEVYANYSDPSSFIKRSLFNIKEYFDARKVINLIGTSGKVLDVGCADGKYLAYMKKFGNWILHGSDINKDVEKIVTRKGITFFLGELEKINISSNTYSIVRMNHLIEHVINPISTFEKAYNILKPGGFLIGETPNISCPDFNFLKRYWGALHMPRHIYLFNTKTLKDTLIKVGFTNINISHTLMTTGWALGIQNYIQSKRKMRLNNGRMKGYTVLLIAIIPIQLIQKITHCSTMISFSAQKI